MIEDKYTYKEVEREKTQLLLENFIGEMVNQNQYTKYKITVDGKIVPTYEATEIFNEKIELLEENEYQELVDKIMNIVFDITFK